MIRHTAKDFEILDKSLTWNIQLTLGSNSTAFNLQKNKCRNMILFACDKL